MSNDSTVEGVFQRAPIIEDWPSFEGLEGFEKLEEFVSLVESGELSPKQISSQLRKIAVAIRSLLTYKQTQEQEKIKDYLTIKEAAARIGKTTQAIYQRIQRGGLPKGTVIKSPLGRGFKILASRLNLF